MTLNEVYEKWLPYKRRLVKASSLSNYIAHWRTIGAVFGPVDIQEITKVEVKKWAYSELEHKSLKYVKGSLITLKQIMRFAQEELEIKIPSLAWNIRWPSENIDGVPPLERYTEQEMRTILEYMLGNPSARNLAIALTLCTGLRIGEICALQWSDIDFDNGLVKISKTVERIQNSLPAGAKTQILFSTPKTTSSYRVIPIPNKLKKVLKAFRAVSLPEYFVATGTPRATEPSVFRIAYKEAVRAAGIQKVLKFHALRHSFASNMIDKGIDVKTVSALLGHSNVSTTLNVYVHPSAETKALAVDNAMRKFL